MGGDGTKVGKMVASGVGRVTWRGGIVPPQAGRFRQRVARERQSLQHRRHETIASGVRSAEELVDDLIIARAHEDLPRMPRMKLGHVQWEAREWRRTWNP
jgi:hypothetical protein